MFSLQSKRSNYSIVSNTIYKLQRVIWRRISKDYWIMRWKSPRHLRWSKMVRPALKNPKVIPTSGSPASNSSDKENSGSKNRTNGLSTEKKFQGTSTMPFSDLCQKRCQASHQVLKWIKRRKKETDEKGMGGEARRWCTISIYTSLSDKK